MIKIIKHGENYEKERELNQEHLYRCGWMRSCNERIGGCGCEFTATLKDFQFKTVGHGESDYITYCPECLRTIYDSFNRVD